MKLHFLDLSIYLFYGFLVHREGCKSFSITMEDFISETWSTDDFANLVIFKVNLDSLNLHILLFVK